MHLKLFGTFLVFALLSSTLYSQQVKPTSKESLSRSVQDRNTLLENSFLKDYPVKSIGPVVQGGRISDIAVSTTNPKTFYVAYASGGLFKTSDNGVSFKPIFDHQDALTIGDIAVAKTDDNIIWVGTGEKNSSRSSYSGTGVYVSLDGGKTWTHKGLTNTQHIGRIIIHPENSDIIWVASIGALYSKNKERGVYKSIDGGKTWKKTLYINDETGIIDLVIDENNPNTLLAASWQRMRFAWDFDGDGESSSIYISHNGGETWERSIDGFPSGDKVGRIGLAISSSNPEIIYALLDNQEETKEEKDEDAEPDELTNKILIDMSKEDFLALEDSTINNFLEDHDYPEKYDAKLVKKEIKKDKYTPRAIATYFNDANKALFDTKITGAEVYRSDNGGKSWKKVNSYALEGVYNTYGYYFGEIRISPDDPEMIYITGVPLLRSVDGGVNYERVDTQSARVHVDHQALWINPSDPEHLILGNDGGLYISYDRGNNWLHRNNLAVGQFYTVNVDLKKPFNVYGGTQDNGVLYGSSRSRPAVSKHWERIMSGDGMFVAIDTRKNNLVYTGYQFGHYFRINMTTKKRKYITPQHDLGELRYRFNWRTPLILSSHNKDILYIGGNKVLRSVDKGDSWDAISDDLTTMHKPIGNVAYSTITSLAESPLKFGIIWVGTDDGNIQVTENGGGTWNLVSKKLPQKRWVSSIFPSSHEMHTVFVALNGFRNDEFNAYIYMSEDLGKTWVSLKGNLPNEVVNVIVQDPDDPDLLYVGTDRGIYVSFNKGLKWHPVGSQLPNVACYDMVVHPRDDKLVIATHGRSMFTMDVKYLREIKDKKDDQIVALSANTVHHSKDWGEKRRPYSEAWEPKTPLRYYVGKMHDAQDLSISIVNDSSELIFEETADEKPGFHFFQWDLQRNIGEELTDDELKSNYVGKGKYVITYTLAGKSDSQELIIK